MELRRLSDSILRSRPLPILSFLVPCVPHRLLLHTAQTPSHAALANLSASSRLFSSRSTLRHSSPVPPEGRSSEPVNDNENDTPADPKILSSYKHQAKLSIVADLLDNTLKDNISAGGTKFRASNIIPRAKNSSFPSSSEVVQSGLANAVSQGQTIQQGDISRHIQFPGQTPNIDQDVARAVEPKIQPRAVKTIKSRPSLGRTIEVDEARGADLARSLRKLEVLCRQNNVRKDQMMQRYHERPGLKRKRLRRERWRKRFKLGFVAMVQKVKAMRRKGW